MSKMSSFGDTDFIICICNTVVSGLMNLSDRSSLSVCDRLEE